MKKPASRPVRNRRPPAATTPAGNTPGRVGQLVAKANRWRDQYNPMRGLEMSRAVALLEAGERGEWADLQWTWRAIEKRNAVCRSLIVRRSAALLKLDWDVKVPEILPAGVTEAMAKAQQTTLRTWYDRVDNLRDALRHLALAEFRGYSHLQVQVDSAAGGEERAAGWEAAAASKEAIYLEPLDQWHWVRDGSRGRWGWNPEAQPVSWSGIPVDRIADPEAWGLIIREVRMPIDEIALLVHIRRAMSQKDWDAFVEIYGVPSGVVVMPNGIPDGKVEDYEAAAKAIAEGGSGALPFGSDYKPNDSPRGVNPFKEHLEYQDSEIVQAGTGGKLTMLTESGSGTLAGGAHQDTFDDIAEAEAAEISEVMQRQFDRRVLALKHPGQPVCAYWELAAVQTDDTDKLVDRIVKLAGIGLRTSEDEASERTGLNLVREEPAVEPGSGSGPGDPPRDPEPMRNREDGRSRFLAASRRQVATAAAADLAPILRRLAAIEGISDPDIRRARMEALLAEWDGLSADIVADPEAAQALARVQGAAAAMGLGGERPGAIRNGRNYERDPIGRFSGDGALAPARISAAEADQQLTQGFTEKGPAGQEVRFGARLKRKLDAASDGTQRKEYLPWARETVRSGRAVPVVEKGEARTVYAKVFRDAGTDRGMLVIVDTADGEAFNIYRKDAGSIRKRYGVGNRQTGGQPPEPVLQAIATAGGLPD